jgi:hypothetical protein
MRSAISAAKDNEFIAANRLRQAQQALQKYTDSKSCHLIK